MDSAAGGWGHAGSVAVLLLTVSSTGLSQPLSQTKADSRSALLGLSGLLLGLRTNFLISDTRNKVTFQSVSVPGFGDISHPQQKASRSPATPSHCDAPGTPRSPAKPPFSDL